MQGSHPGPLSFWLLAPAYRLFGSTAWALHLSMLVLDTIAIGLAVVLSHRIGGRRLAAGVATLISLLVVGYGLGAILEPWNPYLPLLWWVVFLLSAWAAVLGQRVALVTLVVSGSLCAQTHVPYLGLCLGVGASTLLILAVAARRDASQRSSLLRWGGAALVVGALLWAPPTIDQLTEEPGNYGLLIDHFASPPEEPVGVRRAATEVLEHLDLGHLVVDQIREPGLLTNGDLVRGPVAWRGALLLVGWAVSAAVAWRRSPSALRVLHGLVGASTVLACYSISRVFGVVWFYLMLWLWAVAGLMALATVWAIAIRWRDGRPIRTRQSALTLAAPVALVALLSVRAVTTAPDIEPSDVQLSRVLHALTEPTAAALSAGAGEATGREGRYIVGFDDALHIGSQAYGLVSELEQAGFDVSMDPAFGVPITHHRTISPADATARIELVTGSYLDEWRAMPGTVEVGPIDLRTPEELADLTRLRSQVVAGLDDEGLSELIPLLDTNLFGAAIDPRASAPLRDKMDRMLRIGMPTSIFITPPGSVRS